MPNLRHAFASAKSDSADSSLIRPSNWNAKLQYTDGSGAPSGTDAVVREVLAADRTYYVRTDGSDTNTGLANTAGGAFLTIQHAWNVVSATLDLAGYAVTIQIADGTYSVSGAPVLETGGLAIIGGAVTVQGNIANTTAVDLTSDATYTIDLIGCYNGVSLNYVKVSNTSAGGYNIQLATQTVASMRGVNHGACVYRQIELNGNCFLYQDGDYTIYGDGDMHINMYQGAVYQQYGGTVTASGTRTFSGQFINCGQGAQVDTAGTTYSGTFVGTRYNVNTNGVINTYGSGANYYPGSVAGFTASGGQYV